MENRKRILFLFERAGQISETYKDEEITAVKNLNKYDVKILSMRDVNLLRKNTHEYTLIDANNPTFVTELDTFIKEFKPDCMHTHYIHNAIILTNFAKRYNVPYTLRTHSYDVLDLNDNELRVHCVYANDDLCLKVLAFPFIVDRLIRCGLKKSKIEACYPVVNFKRFFNPYPIKRSVDKTHLRVLGVGATIEKKNHEQFIDLAVEYKKLYPYSSFSLYLLGYNIEGIKNYNEHKGTPVEIKYVEPEDMPNVYWGHDWLVYTCSSIKKTIGLPLAIGEAQASGIGICLQRIPDRDGVFENYLDGGGYLFDTNKEVIDIISKPYPYDKRIRGYVAAKRSDVTCHIEKLENVWDNIQ